MNFSRCTLPLQRILLGLQAIQFFYLSFSYLNGTYVNQFDMLERLFKGELAQICTTTGCWQSLTPFVGSLYGSVAILCVLALFFRAGRELRLVIINIASVQIVMATVRLAIVPADFYPDGMQWQLSLTQFVIGALLLLAAALPYPQSKEKAVLR
ncbi:hypothetical protein R50073_07150 [Maricurvus nonylphenolicus]|uniref:hypothetical protein n=1 Tax=Maricurvus nonylphenolicus TaxID=1008307 RepID=UPI0036F31022